MINVFSQKYLEKEGFIPGCLRVLIEFPEIFQRKIAIGNAIELWLEIDKTFNNTLKATHNGYQNSEEQYESVNEASDRLRFASTLMQENIHAHGIKIEWAESLDQMGDLISGMRDRIISIQKTIEGLEGIQTRLYGLGFRTKISSLNAIVNAAQTGDKGEIFSAVAEKTRKGSDDIREHISHILINIKKLKESIGSAEEIFTNLDKAMEDFRITSDKMIDMSNKIEQYSEQQEQTLEQISSVVKKVGRYTRGSKRRYKAISLKESDLKKYVRNASNILQTRKGFWGPFRLNKKVSLDNQRKNMQGVESLVRFNQELITEELEALAAGDQEIGSILTSLDTMNSSLQQVLDNTKDVKKIMDLEIVDGLEKMSDQGTMFGKRIDLISDILNQVKSISLTMQGSVLFNDMLPIVANMAALLVENKTNLLFRSQELDELLNQLNQVANSIEDFLQVANREVSHIIEMHHQMISEINNNRKIAANISSNLETIIKNLMQQPEQINSISSESEVIVKAIQLNRGFAEMIHIEIEQLTENVTAYYNILDKRADQTGANQQITARSGQQVQDRNIEEDSGSNSLNRDASDISTTLLLDGSQSMRFDRHD